MKLKSKWLPEEIKRRLPPNGGLGFLFHATDRETISFGAEGHDWSDEMLWKEPPFIASPIFYGNQVIGANIIIPPPADLWANGHTGIRRFRQDQFLPALQLAEACGLNWLGLAALVPHATDFGQWGKEHRSLFVTTGHAATVAAIRKQIDTFGEQLGFVPSAKNYAIFGAAGSIGSNCARWFAATGLVNLILVDRPERALILQSLAEELKKGGSCQSVRLRFSDDLGELGPFDVGVVATSSSSPWLERSVLDLAPLWIDDSHPQAASTETQDALGETTIYAECFLRGPHGLSQVFPFRLPTSRDCYSCFAEVFMCWHERMHGDFVVGKATVDQITYADKKLQCLGFEVGPINQKSGKQVSQRTLDTVRRTLARSRT